MFKALDNNIPLKAFVLRLKRIMEQKGWSYDEPSSKIQGTSKGTYIVIAMTKEEYELDLSILPLEDDIFVTIFDKNIKMIGKGFIGLDNLVKLNIDNLLTNRVNGDIIKLS